MDQITKSTPTNPIIPKNEDYLSIIANKDQLKVGDLFFDSFRAEYILKIKSISTKDYGHGANTYVELYVVDPENLEEMHSWSSPVIDEFIEKYSALYIRDYFSYKEEAQKYLFLGKPFELQEDSDSNNTGLVHNNNKTILTTIYGDLEYQKQKISLLNNMISILIKQKRMELDSIRDKMQKQITAFSKQMEQISKVIGMIELYMGIEEELYQLKVGVAATIDTPLSLRQLVLYADEEVGNCYDGGIDYTKLDLFDKWLIDNDNYKTLLPEERGIVALRPRRNDKDYGDRYTNADLNRWNKQTYFLIRNGENIYRICSPHLSVGNTFFPKRKEYEELILKNESCSIDKFKDMYTKLSLFIQGLIDRTNVFAPIQQGIKISDIESKYLNLIYDAEATFPTGRLPFNEWRKEINNGTDRGSRIVLIPSTYSESNCWCSYKFEGFYRYYEYKNSEPDCPKDGIYTVEAITVEDGDTKYGIRYLPDADVWTRCDYHKRKNKVTWMISLNRSWYLNYDHICLEDIDFYINSRIDRADYMNTLPLLRTLRKYLIEEQAKEEDFKKLLQGIAIKKGINCSESKIDEAISWWKLKNIWKRPITEDDVKATRMITKRLGL